MSSRPEGLHVVTVSSLMPFSRAREAGGGGVVSQNGEAVSFAKPRAVALPGPLDDRCMVPSPVLLMLTDF